MGSSTSRFKDAVRRGDEEEAYDLFFGKKSIRDGLEWSELLDREDKNSLLHFSARHGMEQLYSELLSRGGKPDQKNNRRQNCLHLICLGGSGQRADMLRHTLVAGLYGMDVKHILTEKDIDGNTALHLSAESGLEDCVQMLVEAGCDLFLTNVKEETAAECATRNGHSKIATSLETKMVFLHGANEPQEFITEGATTADSTAVGMADRDIRSMKDQLLIDTSQLLGVSLFVAESLLRCHGWSKEQLLEVWMEDPARCCEEAGVVLPANLSVDNLDESAPSVPVRGEEEEEEECGICTLPCGREVEVPCEHIFCRDCWKCYLNSKIETGDTVSIACPAYGCYRLVPQSVIETVVSREMAQRYLSFDIKAFVDSNPLIRWCPHPGCGRAVNMAPGGNPDVTFDLSPTTQDRKETGLTVHCGDDHYFCWDCGEEPHEPCDCDQWKKWLAHVMEMQPKIGDKTSTDLNEAESNKWLATRSKPCPKCHIPIERTEGCNHMVCRKCRHDFCWVCLDEWKIHNSSTGGYFECNRYDAQKKARDMLKLRKEEVLGDFSEVEKIGKFLHYYERFKGHRESLELEQPFLNKARHKMVELAALVQNMEHPRGSFSGKPDMSFIEEAVKELLMCRRMLRASYGFAFYLQGNTRRRYFENVQGSLEQVAEMLAEVVARPHLRKPRAVIIRLTREASEKRARMVKESKILPPSTPPSSRRFLSSHSPWDEELSSGDEEELGAAGHSALLRLMGELQGLRARTQEREKTRERGSDNELQQVLQASRQEFEEEAQLKADIELAKELSMRCSPPSQPGSGSEDDTEDSSWPILNIPPLRLAQVPTPPPIFLPPPAPPPIFLPPLNVHQPAADSSPSSNGDPVGEGGEEGDFGPLVSEEEDFRRAIELSLQDAPPPELNITGPQFDSNRLVDTPPLPPSLPLELQHLLQSSDDRSGKAV